MPSKTQQLIDAITALESPEEQIEAIEGAREALHEISPLQSQPVDYVRWVPIEWVSPNDYNPNSVAGKEMGLLYTSIWQDGYCVEQGTPILCADLIWRAAGTLTAGQELIAFDEHPQEAAGRRYRKAKVTANALEESPVVTLQTDRGTLTCTPDHPVLAKRCYGKGHHDIEWAAAIELKPDDLVLHLMDTWEYQNTRTGGWLAGFLDADGTIAMNDKENHRLAAYQRPSKTADRMVAAMRSVVPDAKVFTVDRKENSKWSDMVMCRVDKLRDIAKVLGSIRPQRLLEKVPDLLIGKALRSKHQYATVQTITQGTATIARLATDTGTYISNGFASHNTQPVVTVYNPESELYEIVDGFHRYFTCLSNPDVLERNHGFLPIVVIDKEINDRMAATVRHNRARGQHSVSGMGSMVFKMLDEGWEDADICNNLGMEPEELLRLKHVTGFSKLFADTEYRKSWETKAQIKLRIEAESSGPD